jgi:transcriptional regulator with XRE-family HTH domain
MGFGLGFSPDQRAMDAQIDEEMLALVTQLTNAINWHMQERGLSRADLAARMHVSPGRVSQILGGGENLTLRTLAALSTALDARFAVELTTLKAGDTYTIRSSNTYTTRDAAATQVAPAPGLQPLPPANGYLNPRISGLPRRP